MGVMGITRGKPQTRLPALGLALAAFLAFVAGSAGGAHDGTQPSPPGAADQIMVEKAKRTMTLWQDGKVIRSYKIALGRSPVGHKQEKSDNRTPEGNYRIVGRNPNSLYHLSLRISYPNDADRQEDVKSGKELGGDIMIHGIKNGWGWLGASHRFVDWTLGCIAVTDAEIEEIWNLVPDGIPITIKP